MAIPRYNDTGSEGLIPQALAGLFRYLMTAVNDNDKGVAGMSLGDLGALFKSRAVGEDPLATSARVEMPLDADSEAELEAEGLWRDLDAADPFEIVVGRTMVDTRANLEGPELEPEPDPSQAAALRLQDAFANARGFQGETAKLETGKITHNTSGGDINNYINAKGAATDELKAAATAARNEINGGQGGPQGPAPNSDVGNLTKLAVSGVAGVMAEAVLPGSGAVMTVAAIGAGTFGVKNSGEFTSPAEEDSSVYHVAAGHDVVDYAGGPQGNVQAPSMGLIAHVVEPSLEDTRVTFNDPAQLASIDLAVARMSRDVQDGANAYRSWRSSDVDATASIGGNPTTVLKASERDMAVLTSDNPALNNEPLMATPKISAMRLA